MPKVVFSKLAAFPGSVTLTEPLTLAHVEQLEDALEFRVEQERVYLTTLDKPKLSAVLACLVSCNLQNVPEHPTIEDFPMSPRKETHELIDWIFSELMKIYAGERQVPNE